MAPTVSGRSQGRVSAREARSVLAKLGLPKPAHRARAWSGKASGLLKLNSLVLFLFNPFQGDPCMAYVDGFVLPVPKRNIEKYREIATQAGKVWREHGALEYRECVADDVKPGELTSFPQSVLLKDDETVVFAYIVFNSRAHRDEVNAKVMSDPRLAQMMDMSNMPFDGKRMFWGGFSPLVEL
jgi:uncharacterized protein YbaA (DUF1428 family)